jgi:hypothetical protein
MTWTSSDFGLRIVDFGFRSEAEIPTEASGADFGRRIVDCGLWISDLGFSPNFHLHY